MLGQAWSISNHQASSTIGWLNGGMSYWYGRTWAVGATWIVLLLVTCWFFIYWNYRQERGANRWFARLLLVTLRMIAIATVVVGMMGWVRYGAKTDLPDLVIGIDVSASMRHVDGEHAGLESETTGSPAAAPAGQSRLENVLRHLSAEESRELKSLSKRYNLRFCFVGETVETIGSQQLLDRDAVLARAAADQSRLGECVGDILDRQQGRPTAAIMLWTDGVTTAGKEIGEIAPRALAEGVPLMFVGVGSQLPPRDFQLQDLRADELVFVDDLVSFEAQLRSIGMDDTDAVVQLLRVGAPVVLAEQRIRIDGDDVTQSVRLTHRPSAEGDFEYQLRVVVDEKEANPTNNLVSRRVIVRDETIRVLLVQDQPSYEYRYLKQLLSRELQRDGRSTLGRRNQAFDLVTVQQSAELEYSDTDETASPLFPIRKEELFEFDVIILGDVRPEQNSIGGEGLSGRDLENLYEFVTERGGGLILIAGPRYMPHKYESTPLARLLPYPAGRLQLPDQEQPLIEPNTIRPSPLGVEFPVMLIAPTASQTVELFTNFEGPYWVARATDLKVGAMVLAETAKPATPGGFDGWPLITLQRIGPGRVLTHFFDESYRWRARQGDIYFERYWLQAIRYLGRQKLLNNSSQLELFTDRERYQYGEPVQVTARFSDQSVRPVNGQLSCELVFRTVSADALAVDEEERDAIVLRQSTDEPDRFFTSLRGLASGTYEVVCGLPGADLQATHQFVIDQPVGERQRLQMDIDELRSAASITRGAFTPFDQADKIWQQIPESSPVTLAPIPPVSVWNLWPALTAGALIFIGCLVSEWLLRKRLGMV